MNGAFNVLWTIFKNILLLIKYIFRVKITLNSVEFMLLITTNKTNEKCYSIKEL